MTGMPAAQSRRLKGRDEDVLSLPPLQSLVDRLEAALIDINAKI
jgi:hypothetical protein